MTRRDKLVTDAEARTRAIDRLKTAIAERSPTTEADREQREQDLETQARYHRERLALYRARLYGSTGAVPARLRDLEQASDDAERRLRHFRAGARRRESGRTAREGGR
jgi:hypothetical protein